MSNATPISRREEPYVAVGSATAPRETTPRTRVGEIASSTVGRKRPSPGADLSPSESFPTFVCDAALYGPPSTQGSSLLLYFRLTASTRELTNGRPPLPRSDFAPGNRLDPVQAIPLCSTHRSKARGVNDVHVDHRRRCALYATRISTRSVPPAMAVWSSAIGEPRAPARRRGRRPTTLTR